MSLYCNSVLKDREVVGIFSSIDAFQGAVDEILTSGFNRAELSILAEDQVFVASNQLRFTADDPCASRVSYVSPEAIGDAEGGVIEALMYLGGGIAAGVVAGAGGALGATVAAAMVVGSAGGAVGAALAKLLDTHYAALLERRLASGGIILCVHTRGKALELSAIDIMKRNRGEEVHVKELSNCVQVGNHAPPSAPSQHSQAAGDRLLSGRRE